MNCNCCCTKVLDFCKQTVCGQIDFDIKAQIAGIHKMITYFTDVQIIIKATFAEEDKIIFPLTILNENYQYTAELYDPDGNKIVIRKNDVDYDCFKFKTMVSLGFSEEAGEEETDEDFNTVVIEAVVDEIPEVSGTTDTVTGIVDGSTTVVSDAFIGVRVQIIRGNIPIPGIDPLDGSQYFTKVIASDTITFSNPLVSGEYIRIETIPQ